ncbi:AzlD domain-containing protein [Rothia sp. AR01]|uniref:AzlD domain-containing protein n=1 Tax=Rothia santali TaxID=2949643 RepID=A0A9X2HI32_9MICC|nr:AzlD domain-containing protein [Rothia santali]MCP3426106.1 AzlD domain-containing protein [Rothia santali]
MPSPGYIVAVIAIAVGITFVLRLTPFLAAPKLRDSAAMTAVSRWMPLGIVVILAVYGLSTIDFSAPGHGVPALSGAAATVLVHVWRRNAVLSIVAGTAVCLVLANLVF